jgi:hypothetical protein
MTSPFPSYTPQVPAKPKTLSRQKERELTVTLMSRFLYRMVVPPHQQMEYSTLIPNYSAPSSVCTCDSGGGSSDQSRMRTIRLHRRLTGSHPGPPNFGFSVRGGREHGTGFFVSAVEQGSEAHCQGLKVSFIQNRQTLLVLNFNSKCIFEFVVF